MVGHGAAHPLVAAVLLDVQDPLLTLRHDLRPLQVKVFVDHLQSHDRGVSHMSEQPPSSSVRTISCIDYRCYRFSRPKETTEWDIPEVSWFVTVENRTFLNLDLVLKDDISHLDQLKRNVVIISQ